MAYLIAIALSLIAFGGFLLVTAFEQDRGIRIFRRQREQLDERAARLSFVVTHVDWSAFLAHLTKEGLERLLHDVAHTSLMIVRMLERELTRAVRAIRARRGLGLEDSRERPSPVTRTMRYLRTAVRTTRRAPKQLDIPRDE